MNSRGKVDQFNYHAGQNEVNSVESIFPMELFGSSSTANPSASFLHDEIDLNRELEGDNSFHPYETETQNASSSSDPIIVLQSGTADYVVEEQGEHDRSMNVKRLSCKRRSPENHLREFSIGESSRVLNEEARIPKRRAAVNQGGTSCNQNTSATPYTGPEISQLQQFEANIDEAIRGPGEHDRSMDVKRLSCKRRSPENHLREISIGESSRVPTEEARIPKRRAAVNQGGTSYSQNTSATPYTGPEISQLQQFEADIDEAIRGPRSGIVRYSYPFASVPGSPLSNTSSYVHASGYYHTYSANMSNSPGWVSGLDIAEDYIQRPHIMNHSAGLFIGSRRQSTHLPFYLDPPGYSLGVESPYRFLNRTTQNQQMSLLNNIEPSVTLLPISGSQSRNTLLSEARHALAVRYYSISSILLELLALQEEISEASAGLTEEEILLYLRQEKFVPITEGTSTNDSCCICQEEYAEGEDIGILDCDHKFHFHCIEEWLKRKNTCPLCKSTALAIPDDLYG